MINLCLRTATPGHGEEVHAATLPLPVSVAGRLWTPRTPLLLGHRVHIIRKLWNKVVLCSKTCLRVYVGTKCDDEENTDDDHKFFNE